MAVRVLANVMAANANTSTGDGFTQTIQLHVAATDRTAGHNFSSDSVYASLADSLTVNQFNDAVISAVISAVQSSTVGVANSWTVDRNDVLISGLFQRA